jgi:hypothetical protein
MSVWVWIPLLLLLLGGAVYVVVIYACARLSGRKGAYRAVELKLCNDPCEAALVIAGQRLLKSEAPRLPLEGCRKEKCLCTYILYDDRRVEQRRGASPYGGPIGGAGMKGERRGAGAGRRTTDRTGNKHRK